MMSCFIIFYRLRLPAILLKRDRECSALRQCFAATVRNKAKEMGIPGYIMKPIVIDKIAGTIRKVLDEGKEK